MGLNSWINSPPPPNQHVFWVSFFLNLEIFVGKKLGKKKLIQGKMQTTKNLSKHYDQKFEKKVTLNK
jgi:hypothetical protein